MNRDDVIDVLSVVAAATRRTVGETDVDVWQAVIGDLRKDHALRGVRDHLREKPGVWLEPGHIVERVRARRRDELDREPDSARDARQKALEAKVAEDVAELAASKSVEAKYTRPESMGALGVRCPWCRAGVGQRCVVPRTDKPLTKIRFHPARTEALTKGGKQ